MVKTRKTDIPIKLREHLQILSNTHMSADYFNVWVYLYPNDLQPLEKPEEWDTDKEQFLPVWNKKYGRGPNAYIKYVQTDKLPKFIIYSNFLEEKLKGKIENKALDSKFTMNDLITTVNEQKIQDLDRLGEELIEVTREIRDFNSFKPQIPKVKEMLAKGLVLLYGPESIPIYEEKYEVKL